MTFVSFYISDTEVKESESWKSQTLQVSVWFFEVVEDLCGHTVPLTLQSWLLQTGWLLCRTGPTAAEAARTSWTGAGGTSSPGLFDDEINVGFPPQVLGDCWTKKPVVPVSVCMQSHQLQTDGPLRYTYCCRSRSLPGGFWSFDTRLWSWTKIWKMLIIRTNIPSLFVCFQQVHKNDFSICV